MSGFGHFERRDMLNNDKIKLHIESYDKVLFQFQFLFFVDTYYRIVI